MVVCELSNYAAAFYGNFMHSLFNLEKKLEENSGKVIYVFYKNSTNCSWTNEMIRNRKKVYFLSNKRFAGFGELKRIITDHHVDILHLHFTVPVIIVVLLKVFYRSLKIIVHFHNLFSGVQPVLPKKRMLNGIKVLLYNRFVDRICGCSRAVYEDLVNSNIKKDKCCYIDNGIDYARLDIPCEDGKKAFNLSGKSVLMIYGTYFYTKGVDLAILAVKDIVEKYGVILMIICQNREFVTSQIIKTIGFMPSWVRIFPSQENIAFYFKMSDVYLTPSREEGFSYALLESIYCGTITIRSDLPGMDRGLPDELIVPVNDVPALRKKIEFVLDSPETCDREDILKRQKEYIVSNFEVNIWSTKIYAMYRDLLN